MTPARKPNGAREARTSFDQVRERGVNLGGILERLDHLHDEIVSVRTLENKP